jgi:high frequency lysogenization protein
VSLAWEKRTLALAGLLQTVHLVSAAARTGMLARDTMETSLASVFVLNPKSISDVYQGTRGIRTGLGLLGDMLKGFNLNAHGEVLRYTLAVIQLERQLAGEPAMLNVLGARLAVIDAQRLLRQADPQQVDDQTIAELAELYESTLSQLEPRIRIAGSRQHLETPANIKRVRALLLAAVRAAVLWHQVGGRRWQFLLGRGNMQHALKNLA